MGLTTMNSGNRDRRQLFWTWAFFIIGAAVVLAKFMGW